QDHQQQHDPEGRDHQGQDRQALDQFSEQIGARGRMVMTAVVMGIGAAVLGLCRGISHGAPSGPHQGNWICSSAEVWSHGAGTTHSLKDQAAQLSAEQCERAAGSVVAAAAGDALGAPYEFQPPVADSEDIDMIGGGVLDWQPSEWTDDTAMSIVVLEAAASTPTGHDLRVESAQDQIRSEERRVGKEGRARGSAEARKQRNRCETV